MSLSSDDVAAEVLANYWGRYETRIHSCENRLTMANIGCYCRWYKFMKSNNNKKLVKLDDRVKQVIQIFLTTLTLTLTMISSGGRDVDHQGGDGGGQREVLVHGQQQRRWRKR